MTRIPPARPSSGLSLIELVMVIVILSVGVAGLFLLINQVTARSADPMVRQQALAIGQSYLEEVLLRPFCDPDLSTDCTGTCTVVDVCSNASCSSVEASRGDYDDICDYDGLSDTGARDQTGAPVTGLAAYKVDVAVIDDGSVALNTLGAGEVVRVDVTVTHGAGENVSLTLSGYRSNY